MVAKLNVAGHGPALPHLPRGCQRYRMNRDPQLRRDKLEFAGAAFQIEGWVQF